MTTNLDTLQQVVTKLATMDIPATLEYPGFIAVPIDDQHVWNIGTANPTWCADLTSPDGSTVYDSTDCEVPSDSRDVELIANLIVELVRP